MLIFLSSESETVGWFQGRLCRSVDVTEALTGRGLPRLLDTLEALCGFETLEKGPQKVAEPREGPHDRTVSLLLLALFVATVVLLVLFPPPD